MNFLRSAAMICCAWFATVNPASAQFWQTTGAPNLPWRSPACSADGTKLVARVGNYLLSSTNSAVTWFTNGAPSNSWTGAACSADGVKLVASAAVVYSPTRGGEHGGPIYTSADSGATWSPTSAPSNQWSAVASSADGSKLVAAAAYNDSTTSWGRIYVSTNSGADWSVTSAPTNIWNCIASSADGTRLIAGCGGIFPASTGAVFVSTDAGTTWTINSVSSDYPSNETPTWTSVASSADGSCLLGIRDLSFYNATNVPRVYASTNFGETWTSTNLPTSGAGYVGMSGNGNVMMVSKGRFYYSTNGGTVWIQRSLPNQQFTWGLANVAATADGNKLYLAVGADSFGSSSTIYTSYTTPRPQLEITPSPTNLSLCWTIPATNFVVQQRLDLSTDNWVTLSNAPTFNPATLENRIELSPNESSGFFRLKAN